MRSRAWIVTSILALAVLAGAAEARAGWAGSRYTHDECNLRTGGGKPSLFCQTSVIEVDRNASETIGVADERCTSGLRLIRRTGTLITRFDVFDFYSGPVPLAKFNIAGNESNFSFEWRDFVDTDLGCG